MSHWVKNGVLKPACRKQRAEYRSKNRLKIRLRQNETYRTQKRRLPTKEQRLQRAQELASLKGGICLSKEYINCKTPMKWKCSIHFIVWNACWNNIKSANSWCPECAKVKRAASCTKKYGVSNPTQNSTIRLKAAKSANKLKRVRNWESGKYTYCQGSYEVAVCRFFNKKKVSYVSQVPFNMPDGRTYHVDFYLPKEDLYIEVKGYMYADAAEKWRWFSNLYKNSELWDRKKLHELSIL